MGSNDDDDVDGGVRFVLTQQDFQLILICIVRVGVAAACVLRLVGDFHESRSDGRTRMDAALMMTRRHGAVPLVLYLFVDTLGSFLENFEALLELRLILLALWAGRVMVTRALLLDPTGREARIDALEALAPFLRVVALAGGVASFVLRSPALGRRAVASRGVLCVLDGSALLGAAFVAALAARMLLPVRRALQAEKKNEAEIAAARAALVARDLAGVEDINRAALGRLEKHVEDVVLYFDGDFDDGRSSGLDRRPADFESRGNDGTSRGRDDLRERLAGEKSSPTRFVGLDGTLEQLQDDLEDLKDLVARSLHASRKHWQNIVGGEVVAKKHWQILVAAADLVRAAGGVRVTSCKSGKDRTGMSVTFEQVRLARKHLDCGDDDVDRVLYLSRLHGTRLENARKNTGRPVFAFNLFQVGMLPAVYRPPLAVANKAVAS